VLSPSVSSFLTSLEEKNSVISPPVSSETTPFAESFLSTNKETNKRRTASLRRGFLAIFCSSLYRYWDRIGRRSSCMRPARIGSRDAGARVRSVSSEGLGGGEKREERGQGVLEREGIR
jgi:hypothetical protein